MYIARATLSGMPAAAAAAAVATECKQASAVTQNAKDLDTCDVLV
jgi:hypothetical protein